MQEEVTQRTVTLCIQTGKLTAELLQKAMKKVLEDMEKHKRNPQLRHGKQRQRIFQYQPQQALWDCGQTANMGDAVGNGICGLLKRQRLFHQAVNAIFHRQSGRFP